MRVDARDDFIALKGLGNEVDRANFEPAHLVFGFVQRRQKDDRSFAGLRILLQAPARFVPVNPWHHDVEQHQHRVYSARHLDGAFAAAGHEEPEATAVKRVTQDVEIRRVVVNQQDAVGVFGERGRHFVHFDLWIRFPREPWPRGWLAQCPPRARSTGDPAAAASGA